MSPALSVKKVRWWSAAGASGIFFSCSNYPECKNAIKADRRAAYAICAGRLMMEGTKTIPERCSNKACPMHNPHKLKNK